MVDISAMRWAVVIKQMPKQRQIVTMCKVDALINTEMLKQLEETDDSAAMLSFTSNLINEI